MPSQEYAPVRQSPGDALGSLAAGTPYNSATTLMIGGGGIIFFLGIYGFLQERLMSLPYDNEYFKNTLFLVLNNRCVAIIFAAAMIHRNAESWRNVPPLWKYFLISVSNVLATYCQYEALKYVSFPVQMLGKSAKMVPVMVWAKLVSNKTYRVNEWVISFGVTGGCMLFGMSGSINSSRAKQEDSIYGIVLLMGYLGADGFTSMFQEKLFAEHKTSKYNQMLYINGTSAIMSLGSLLASNTLGSAIAFCYAHPAFFVDSVVLSLSATAGQFCIYTTIKEFGAVVFAACMNVRQVTNITISLIYYGHMISLGQFVGLAMVFGFLFYKVKLSKEKEDEKKKASASLEDSELPTVGKSAEGKP
jgi:adenosine 3'-phospho 5'-phosphosulfate transporter B2